MLYRKSKKTKNLRRGLLVLLLAGIVLILAVVLIPGLRMRILWRLERTSAYLRGVIDPVQAVPTAMITPRPSPTTSPSPTTAPPTPTLEASPTPLPTATPLPGQANLAPPPYEKQGMNNCGPNTLSMHLHYYGWEGDQYTISNEIKPEPKDRNVNVEELSSYVLTNVPGLRLVYRVGGNPEILKRLLANGFPVTIETSMKLDETSWPNDDQWAGHYLLITGYDEAQHIFVVQDSFRGPNQYVPFDVLMSNWDSFNHVYIVIYPTDQESLVQTVLGTDWDADANRARALEEAQQATEKDPNNPYAWFNLGSNLVYFERYGDAVTAYDTARTLPLPQRMFRYQFGPFFAYFHTGRIDDLITICDYALKITPNSEEALLWKGWAMYRQNNLVEATALWEKALAARPNYPDAIYALQFLQGN